MPRPAVLRPAPHDEDRQTLLVRYATDPTPRDLDLLVRSFAPLAYRLAFPYARGREHREDLEQVALMGLIKALQRFDPAHGNAFSSFAVPTILGEIKRHLRDTSWAIHVPRVLQERAASVRDARREWMSAHGSAPRTSDLAMMLDLTEEEITEACSAASARAAQPLDAPARTSEEDGSSLAERLGHDDPGYDLVEDRHAIANVLPLLTRQQRAVLRLRIDQDMKQSAIAAELGCSQMQVSRQLRSATARLAQLARAHSDPAKRP